MGLAIAAALVVASLAGSMHPRVVQRPATESLIARVRPGQHVGVRLRPRGPVVAWLSSRTEFGSPQTFSVTRALLGRRFAVVTTALANGRVGWIDARPGTLTLSRTRITLDVDLSRHALRVLVGRRVVRGFPVGIGAPGTPTPTGRFAVTDKLSGAAFSPVYGCCILALSAHQTHLPRRLEGRRPDRDSRWLDRRRVSNGCLHASTAALRYLMRLVPLGARVVIHP